MELRIALCFDKERMDGMNIVVDADSGERKFWGRQMSDERSEM